jgi:hypothetical protein
MRIDPKLRILAFLMVGAFVLSVCSASEVLAAGKGSKQTSFKTAQTKAHRILTGAARTDNAGVAPAQQFNVAPNQPTVCYGACPPGWSGGRPVYTWFFPAQPYGGTSGRQAVAGGGWQTPAGQGATAPQQNVATAQATPATGGNGSRSLCYWLPSWSTVNAWNAPATSGGTVPTYNQLAQPGVVQTPGPATGPATVCYSGCLPSWSGPGYTTGAYCGPVCY